MMRLKAAIAGLTGALALSCIPSAVAAADAADALALPPWVGAYEPQDLDERGMWQDVDELEKKLQHSKFIIREPALQTYLERVLCDAVGDDRCTAARIYIVRENSFNAGMYPTGAMFVHSGLLLRLRNEAELASVLGHEFGHFEKRHALQRFKQIRSGTDLIIWTALITGIDMSGAVLLDIFNFSRENEEEADLVGSAYLARSPYPSRAAADVWVRLIDEDDARAEERKRRKRGRHTGWFDSHPAPLQRADYLARAAEASADEGEYRSDEYSETLAPYLLGFFDDQLQRNDFAASKYILEQSAGDYWRPLHYIMQGELYRKRGNPRDLVTAEESFRRAIDDGTSQPEAWRGLGLTLMRRGDRAGGAEALKTYLEMAPDAPDAPMMTMMIGGSQ